MGQAGVTGTVDAVGVGVKFGAAATATGVGDVPAQSLQDTSQRCGAVQDRLTCILGRRSVLEVEEDDLDSELHITWWSKNKLSPKHSLSMTLSCTIQTQQLVMTVTHR